MYGKYHDHNQLILHMLTIVETHNKYIAYMNIASHAVGWLPSFSAETFYPFSYTQQYIFIYSIQFEVTNTHSRIKQTNKQIHENGTRKRELQNCATKVKQAKSIVMPFSESHFSRAQWLFYMIVAFSCLRSVMLLKWNQKRPIFVHFLRNYSVIRVVYCCCCYSHCCRCFCNCCCCCWIQDFIFTRLRSHLMVSNLFYLIHMRNGNESILWMGLFMATNRFHSIFVFVHIYK